MASWLRAVGLSQYAEAFESQDVDGPSLRLLSRDDLNALGVRSVGHRLQILRGVGELRGGDATPRAGAGTTARSLQFSEEQTEA